MRVIINGYAFNDPANRVYLNEDIEGLDYPPIRTSRGQLSGQDGGYVGSQLRGSREITLPGTVFSADVTEAKTKRRELQAIFLLYPSVNEVVIEDDDGSTYLIYAQLIDFKMPIKRSPLKSKFKVELLAPDPIIYDNADGSELSVTLQRVVAGGHTWPIVWPLVWSAATGPVTATNSGKVFVKPTITLHNIMTNPVITNVTTGQVFSLTGLATSTGDVVEIDMRARTVTLNGGNIFDKVAPNSEWWGLPVGPNDIKLESSSGSDDVTGELTWRNGVLGI